MSKVHELRVNGRRTEVSTDPERSLLSVLRDELDLTGTKYGCGEGQCGACTVLVDGDSVRSCMTAVGSVAGKEITTIEGLELDGKLHPVQESFIESEAMQCGYCTPGMILSAVALLRRDPGAGRQEILRQMEGNICRCGTYPRILDAVERVAAAGRTAGKEEGR